MTAMDGDSGCYQPGEDCQTSRWPKFTFFQGVKNINFNTCYTYFKLANDLSALSSCLTSFQCPRHLYIGQRCNFSEPILLS